MSFLTLESRKAGGYWLPRQRLSDVVGFPSHPTHLKPGFMAQYEITFVICSNEPVERGKRTTFVFVTHSHLASYQTHIPYVYCLLFNFEFKLAPESHQGLVHYRLWVDRPSNKDNRQF